MRIRFISAFSRRTGALALLALLPMSALAANNVNLQASLSSSSAPAVGKLVRGTQSSTFKVDASTGTVTRTSGNAVRVTAGAATTPTVTLSCSSTGNQCTNGNPVYTITVTLGSASPNTSANLSLTTDSVANLSGATIKSGPSVSGNVLTFTIGGFTSASFKLGATLNVPAAAVSANVSMPFTVTIQ